MASSDILNSSAMALYVGGNTSTAKVAFSIDAEVQLTLENRDTTNKDSQGWRSLLEGLRSFSMSAGALYYNNPSAWGFGELFAMYKNRTAATTYMLSDLSDDIYYYGSVRLAQGTLSSPNREDNVQYDVNFDGTGVLSEGNG